MTQLERTKINAPRWSSGVDVSMVITKATPRNLTYRVSNKCEAVHSVPHVAASLVAFVTIRKATERSHNDIPTAMARLTTSPGLPKPLLPLLFR